MRNIDKLYSYYSGSISGQNKIPITTPREHRQAIKQRLAQDIGFQRTQWAEKSIMKNKPKGRNLDAIEKAEIKAFAYHKTPKQAMEWLIKFHSKALTNKIALESSQSTIKTLFIKYETKG